MSDYDPEDPIGLALAILDDLFAGRARLHAFNPGSAELIGLGAGEPPLSAPGVLHDAIGSDQVLTVRVDDRTIGTWDPTYRAWIPRGDVTVTARRIEGGGEVVGVLSVVRADQARVPVIEDAEIVAALAGRFGRTLAVALLRAGGGAAAPTAAVPARPPPGAERTEIISSAGDVEVVSSFPDEADLDEVEYVRQSIRNALRLPADLIDVVGVGDDGTPDMNVRETLVASLSIIAAVVHDRLPAGGVTADVRFDGVWVVDLRPSVRGRSWPRTPAIDERLGRQIEELGAEVEVVARPEAGWVIQLRVAGVAVPPAETVAGSAAAAPQAGRAPGPAGDRPAVDLMAASLGDTTHMVMVALDPEGRVVFCNDELANRLGSSVADLLARPLRAARGSSGAWDDFDDLLRRAEVEGMVQGTVAWPHPENSGRQVLWTVSRSTGADGAPVALCFGVDSAAENAVSEN